jgi:hypothetical protein
VSCEQVRQQLPDHVLGTLPDTELAAIRRHLRGCAGCRAEASELGQGLSLFARAAHTTEPPEELKPRVMAVLSEDWTDETGPGRGRIGVLLRWPAVAALIVLLAGTAGWAAVAQVRVGRLGAEAATYERFLEALGGKEVRVASFESSDVVLDGSAILYDSARGQSWVLVLARAPGYSQPLTVRLSTPEGRSISVRFPLEFEESGDGWTGMVTHMDISRFSIVELVAPDGQVVASAGTISP